MKATRKVLLTIFFSSLLLSCSSDDDSTSTETQSLIIGTWKPIKEIDRCPNQADDVYTLTDCEQMGRITFNVNGNFNEIGYNENNGNCEVSFQSNSSWEIRNGKLYADDNGIEEEVEFFEVSENTLRLGELDDDFCNGGIFFTEYVKVE